MSATLRAGERLAHYDIGTRLGAGGMGEVYRAYDARLSRDVAIKVLPPDLAGDGAFLQRFEQEARAASALNHPNVVTIYEVGEAEGRRYIAMELVEGRSVFELLQDGRVPAGRAVDIAAQAARGLAAAHAKGIVHRDLKPENVIVRPDGLVKVLDFGLAKWSPPVAAGTAAPSGPALTQMGTVVGTPSYMSPEQARGEAVDFRSDQFSFGALLYEMLTGRRAFEKATAVQTMSAILEETPAPVDALAPGLPIPVRWVVDRCLAKNPDDRYAATRDLSRDLERVRELVGGPRTSATLVARPAVSPRRVAALAAALLAFGTLALVGGWISRTIRPNASPASLRYLTYSGSDIWPAASADGRTIAFSSSRDGTRRIWLKQLSDGTEAALTSGPDEFPCFTPDGAFVLFARRLGEGSALFRIPTVGGPERRLVENATRPGVSPDGRRIAFLRPVQRGGLAGFDVLVAQADGSSARVVGYQSGPIVGPPRFSPDGVRLAFVSGNGTFGNPWSIVLLGVEDGSRTVFDPPSRVGGLSTAAWVGGERLVYGQTSSVVPGLSSGRLLLHDLASGKVRALASSLVLGDTLDVVAEGKVVFTGASVRANLHLSGGAEPRWLTRGQSIDRQPLFTPDGSRLLFTSNRDGNLDLWEVAVRSGAVRRLTDDPAEDWDPFLSRDGRTLYWSSRRTGHFEIWRANADGSDAQPVTSLKGDAENPSATPDGEWVVFGSYVPESAGVWKVRRDGSGRTKLFGGTAGSPEVSPDGRHVLLAVSESLGSARLAVIRLADGAPVDFEIPLSVASLAEGYLLGRCHWIEDGRAVAWVGQDAKGRVGIYAQDFAPGRDTAKTRRVLSGFDGDTIPESFAVTRDGALLVVSRYEWLANLVLAEGLEGVSRPRR